MRPGACTIISGTRLAMLRISGRWVVDRKAAVRMFAQVSNGLAGAPVPGSLSVDERTCIRQCRHKVGIEQLAESSEHCGLRRCRPTESPSLHDVAPRKRPWICR
jgi:hypothetical protein